MNYVFWMKMAKQLSACIWISARRFNPELKEYYDMKRSQGKHSNVAANAVARKPGHPIY